MLADARPQAQKNRRRIHSNTLRLFLSRERRRCLEIIRRSRMVLLGQTPSPHFSRGFVTKPLRRVMRRARAARKEGSILEPYVDRLSGKHARRNSVSAIVVETFANNAGWNST